MHEIKKLILEIAEKHNVPVSEVHVNINEPAQQHITFWQYSHKHSSESLNVVDVGWKHLETKKIL
jgi:hypothetical protein